MTLQALPARTRMGMLGRMGRRGRDLKEIAIAAGALPQGASDAQFIAWFGATAEGAGSLVSTEYFHADPAQAIQDAFVEGRPVFYNAGDEEDIELQLEFPSSGGDLTARQANHAFLRAALRWQQNCVGGPIHLALPLRATETYGNTLHLKNGVWRLRGPQAPVFININSVQLTAPTPERPNRYGITVNLASPLAADVPLGYTVAAPNMWGEPGTANDDVRCLTGAYKIESIGENRTSFTSSFEYRRGTYLNEPPVALSTALMTTPSHAIVNGIARNQLMVPCSDLQVFGGWNGLTTEGYFRLDATDGAAAFRRRYMAMSYHGTDTVGTMFMLVGQGATVRCDDRDIDRRCPERFYRATYKAQVTVNRGVLDADGAEEAIVAQSAGDFGFVRSAIAGARDHLVSMTDHATGVIDQSFMARGARTAQVDGTAELTFKGTRSVDANRGLYSTNGAVINGNAAANIDRTETPIDRANADVHGPIVLGAYNGSTPTAGVWLEGGVWFRDLGTNPRDEGIMTRPVAAGGFDRAPISGNGVIEIIGIADPDSRSGKLYVNLSDTLAPGTAENFHANLVLAQGPITTGVNPGKVTVSIGFADSQWWFYLVNDTASSAVAALYPRGTLAIGKFESEIEDDEEA
ncbi:hypothetical protein [Brevundimonas sp.]|uniref:hypothetical protein n=1 Tax=Brevundimonas sp. TaxID=1871086 RepID=UPI002D61341F|nr:hypothetical protein [Brevundimonas sp.]HYD26961.1 hypothetical protein [Brevundimonas sp.]